MDRRTLITTTATGAAGILAGCSGILGSNDDSGSNRPEGNNSSDGSGGSDGPPFTTVEPPAQDLLLEPEEIGDQWSEDRRRTTDGSDSAFDQSNIIEVADRQYINGEALYLSQYAALFRNPSAADTGWERTQTGINNEEGEIYYHQELSVGEEGVVLMGGRHQNRGRSFFLQGNVIGGVTVEPSDDEASRKEKHFRMAIDISEQLYNSWG